MGRTKCERLGGGKRMVRRGGGGCLTNIFSVYEKAHAKLAAFSGPVDRPDPIWRPCRPGTRSKKCAAANS